jgi:hypothetical protein
LLESISDMVGPFAQRAVAVAAAELTQLVDAMQLFEARRATVRYFGRA